jgi:hypothetical protein
VAIEHGHANDRADDLSSVLFGIRSRVSRTAASASLIERLTGDDRIQYIQRPAWALASGADDAGAALLETFLEKARHARKPGANRGLIAYRKARQRLRSSASTNGNSASRAHEMVEKLPEDQRFQKPKIDLPQITTRLFPRLPCNAAPFWNGRATIWRGA